jgi:hypothetical protein
LGDDARCSCSWEPGARALNDPRASFSGSLRHHLGGGPARCSRAMSALAIPGRVAIRGFLIRSAAYAAPTPGRAGAMTVAEPGVRELRCRAAADRRGRSPDL